MRGISLERMVHGFLGDYIECTIGAYRETLLKRAAQS